MTEAIRIIEPGETWDGLLRRLAESGQADVYFDHRYLALYATGGKKAWAFVYEDGGSLFFLPHLLNRVDTEASDRIRYDFETAYGYSGPLSSDRDKGFLSAAWRAFDEYCAREGIVAGFFRFHPFLENHRLAETSSIEVIAERQTVFIDLDQDEETVWQAYASDNRNRIRKSEKLGVAVNARDDAEALRAFSALYKQRMTELNADTGYFFGDSYFDKIAGLGPGRYRVYLAQAGANVIGGALVLFSDRFAHYHLSSAPQEYQRYATNNMLRHAVIVSLLGGPYEKLHFGGGRTSDPDDPLFKFKQRFSKSFAEFHIGRYVADPSGYEAICDAWKRDNPGKVPEYGSLVLCYRHT